MSEYSDNLTPDQYRREGAEAITMTYRNWRGEVGKRAIIPIRIWFGATEWHPTPGWLLSALDLEKGVDRDFALADCQFSDLTPAPDAVARLVLNADRLLPEFLATAARNIDFDGPWDDFDLSGGLRAVIAAMETDHDG